MSTLEEIILRSAVCPHDCAVTAAFSGGADSTALLLALFRLRERLGITLSAVHVHHGIRGAEADRDAAFCAETCAKYGIPFQCVYVDAPAFAAESTHRSLEEAARELRYEALLRAAPEGEIAAAHHRGDQAETVLFHLIRGSGLRGLTGIPERSGRIIRPMLAAQKADILGFLAEIGQSYTEDSTNVSGENVRSRLRRDILPALMRENPQAEAHIARTAELLRADADYLDSLAAAAFEKAKTAFGGLCGIAEQPRPLRMRMYMLRLRALPAEVRIDPSYRVLSALDALVTAGRGQYAPTRRLCAQMLRGTLYLNPKAEPVTGLHPLAGMNIPQCVVPGCTVTPVLSETAPLSRNLHDSDTRVTLDPDKIKGSPYFRQWTREDAICLPGRGFRSRLSACIAQNVPAAERRRLHILCDAEGVIFCEAVGIDGRVRPDANSRRTVMLRIVRPDCAHILSAESG